MSNRDRAQVFRQQARAYCVSLERYLRHGVLPIELLADLITCVVAANEIDDSGVILS